jgi:ERCC4-related helicase
MQPRQFKNQIKKPKIERRLIDISEADNLFDAVDEWNFKIRCSLGKNKKLFKQCLCGSHLKNVNIMINKKTNNPLPIFIGDDCLKQYFMDKVVINKKSKKNKMAQKIMNDIPSFSMLKNIKTASELLISCEKIVDILEKVYDKLNNDIITFGKYKGETIYNICKSTQGYAYLKHFILSNNFKLKINKYEIFMFSDSDSD